MTEINSKLFRDDPAAYYTELGAQAERERILKIIADYRNKPSFGYANLISLIKGEQK